MSGHVSGSRCGSGAEGRQGVLATPSRVAQYAEGGRCVRDTRQLTASAPWLPHQLGTQRVSLAACCASLVLGVVARLRAGGHGRGWVRRVSARAHEGGQRWGDAHAHHTVDRSPLARLHKKTRPPSPSPCARLAGLQRALLQRPPLCSRRLLHARQLPSHRIQLRRWGGRWGRRGGVVTSVRGLQAAARKRQHPTHPLAHPLNPPTHQPSAAAPPPAALACSCMRVASVARSSACASRTASASRASSSSCAG